MALASNHLATSRPEYARATTPRGTCTAAEGLNAETFCGFQFAGKLFFLTFPFIEPIAHGFDYCLRSQTNSTSNFCVVWLTLRGRRVAKLDCPEKPQGFRFDMHERLSLLVRAVNGLRLA